MDSINIAKTDVSDLTLMSLMQTTQAQAEDGGGSPYSCWNSYTSGISGTRMCPACNIMWFTSGTGSMYICRI